MGAEMDVTFFTYFGFCRQSEVLVFLFRVPAVQFRRGTTYDNRARPSIRGSVNAEGEFSCRYSRWGLEV